MPRSKAVPPGDSRPAAGGRRAINDRARDISRSDDPRPPAAVRGRRRSTRDRPAKTPLSEQAVVDAALEILRSEGIDAVTMRRVAAALDTGAASLYVYVQGRDGLLAAMLDRVTADLELEIPDPARWQQQLHDLMGRIRALLEAHPGLAAFTLARPPDSDTVLMATENLMGILLAGGLSPQDAAWACDVLVLLVTAVACEHDVRSTSDEDVLDQDHIDGMYRRFAELPAQRFPLITAHAAEMVSGDSDQRFHFAVDVLVAGIAARAR